MICRISNLANNELFFKTFKYNINQLKKLFIIQFFSFNNSYKRVNKKKA